MTIRRLSADDIARVRADHPITDVLDRLGSPLPARGAATLRISCPMPDHPDEHPSCVVHSDTNRFHCFSCGADGDVFTLVREHTGLTNLADIADFLDTGTTRPHHEHLSATAKVEQPQCTTSRDQILEVNAEAWTLLTAPLPAHVAHNYLTRRGLDTRALRDTLGSSWAGYTPASRYGLTQHLHRAGFTDDEIFDAGWALRRDDTLIDRFRRRVVLPVRDTDGHVLGVIGRDVTGTATHKYLNTPDTPAFRKGAVLYRPTDTPLHDHGLVIVCEGAIDALAITAAAARTGQHRRLTAVSPSGTALTPTQADLITSIDRTVVVCADGDDAGRAAAAKWADVLRDAGCRDVDTIPLVDGHDPASLLKQAGPTALNAIAGGRDISCGTAVSL